MEIICDKKSCVGCFACKNVCPKNAISVKEDELGKTVPVIDNSKCVDCKLCQKVCPINNKSEYRYPSVCYAIKNKNKDDEKISSSGGASSGFARYFIDNNGYVYGSRFTENMILLQDEADTQEKADEFRGSKYVQSYTGKSYSSVKRRLEEGKLVLYTGTPCQIDGLRHYLRRDYDNLLTMDLVCHGTPPIKYLKEYAKAVTGKRIDRATFRGKDDFKLCLYKGDKREYYKDRFDDLYFTAFLESLSYRDNCYNCRYARNERVSDITMGDFWGLDRSTLKSGMDGRISEILINTEKGKRYFELIKDRFIYEERSVTEAIEGNTQLREPSKVPSDRKRFEENYKKYGFYIAVKKSRTSLTILERKTLKNIKKVAKKILRRK